MKKSPTNTALQIKKKESYCLYSLKLFTVTFTVTKKIGRVKDIIIQQVINTLQFRPCPFKM